MGVLLAVWMFVSMLGAITILPVMIVTFNPSFIHREKDRLIASRALDVEGNIIAKA
jgi:hypothetical protein